MINWWIRPMRTGWVESGWKYVLMADDCQIADFNSKEDALLFAREFKTKVEEA